MTPIEEQAGRAHKAEKKIGEWRPNERERKKAERRETTSGQCERDDGNVQRQCERLRERLRERRKFSHAQVDG